LKHIGITGHQGLNATTARNVNDALSDEIARAGRICAVSSLAEGADQLFAEEVLRQGGALLAVIPSAGYEKTFSDQRALERYRRLLSRATDVIELGYDSPGEEAYWAAGKEVVKLSDRMLAVWDGEPSAGLGGTADIVDFAHSGGKLVTIIWPQGSNRD
jgi:hypothetical protein